MTTPEVAPERGRSALAYLPLFFFLALVGLFLLRLFAGDASRLPSALIGRQIPQFALPAVEGLDGSHGLSNADLATLGYGHATLVNVFASWCVPCHQEHSLILKLARDGELARLGVKVVGIAYKDAAENIADFLKREGNPFARIGDDRNGRVAIDFGVYGVPETFIIKGDGTIAYRFVGPMSEEAYQETILPEIEKALR
jgi:cytochrome c biogenesis protein CcmG/thiol:disulfide interchange protein DsbE